MHTQPRVARQVTWFTSSTLPRVKPSKDGGTEPRGCSGTTRHASRAASESDYGRCRGGFFCCPDLLTRTPWHTIDLTGDKRPCHSYSQPLDKSHVAGDGSSCVPCSPSAPGTMRPIRSSPATRERSPI